MNFNTMSKQRKFVFIAGVIGIVAMFLPWASISALGVKHSVSGMHDLGYLAFLAYGGTIAVSLLNKQDENLDKRMWIVALGCGAIAFLITLYAFLEINTGDMIYVSVSYGIGIFMSLAAGAGVVASAWVFKNADDTLKSGFDALKAGMNNNPTPPPTSNPQ